MICRLIKNKGLATAPQRHVGARRTNPGLKYRRVFETVSGAMLLAAVLGGCSKESDGGPDGADGKLIKFTPAVNAAGPGTRALPGSLIESDDNIPTGGSFGVYAYGKLTPTSDVVSYNSELRDNTKVTSNGTDFIYNPVARWPIRKDAELTFYGYYPWQDPGTTPAPGSHKINVTMGGQNAPSMSIDYTTPADPSKQVDLMYAYAEPTTGFDPIEMNFRHALTRVRFKARVEDYPIATDPVRITSITVTDVKTFGRLIVEDENTPKWWYQSNDEDIKLADGNGLRPNYALTGTLATVIDTDGDLLLIPQEVKDMVVSVETTIGNGPGATAKTFTYPLSGTSDWEMNQVVTYEITISGDGMKLIAKVNDWAGNDVEVIHDGQWWMTVDEDEFEFDVNAGTKTLPIETNYNPSPSQGFPVGLFVEAVADPSKITYDPALNNQSPWLTLTDTGSGADGDLNRAIELDIAPNNAMAVRKASFTVTAGNLTKVIHVTQQPHVITDAEVVYGDINNSDLPLKGDNSTTVTFHLWGTFPVGTARVRVRYSTSQPPYNFTIVAGDGIADGNAVSQQADVTRNSSWEARDVFSEYFDPHAGTAGEWIMIDTQPQPGYEITAVRATKWESAETGTSTVTISGYRPAIQVRAVDANTGIQLTGSGTVTVSGNGASASAAITIPELPNGVNEREIRIEYDRNGTWEEITTFTQIVPITSRFARSNIVWDGSKLTFAVTEADNSRIPANVQGVFFRWGSLVAVSPVGNYFGGGAVSGNPPDPDKILFSPTGKKDYVWEDIPHIDENYGIPFDNNDPDEDDFDGFNDGNNTNGPGYSTSTNRGDICRYISAQNWVVGQWRMPTATEYNELLDEIPGSRHAVRNGTFNQVNRAPESPAGNVYGLYANGFWQPESGSWLGGGAAADKARGAVAVITPGPNSVYFPAGGERNHIGQTVYAGGHGYFWSASSNSNSVDMFSIHTNIEWVSSMGRNAAISIRCIRDE